MEKVKSVPALLSYSAESPVRIIFLMSSLTIGGSEKKVTVLANHLAREGWNVEVAYLNPPEDLLSSLSGSVGTTCFDRRRPVDLNVAARVRQFLIAETPTIVVSVNLFPLFYLFLSRCLGYEGDLDTVVLINKMNYSRGVVGKVREAFYARVLKKADRLVFGAEHQRRHWEAAYGLSHSKSTVIYNGVDTNWYSPSAMAIVKADVPKSLKIEVKEFVLVTVASLRLVKRIDILLEALAVLRAEYPELKAVIVGDGPDRKRLQAMVEGLALQDVVAFSGATDDVRAILGAADLFVLTSESETFSNAALEAMSMGKPVLLPNVGGCAEMVRAGIDGWLFSSGSVNSLAEYIRRAIDDVDQCRLMGQAARRAAIEKFPMDAMFDGYKSMFREMIRLPR